MGLKENLQKRFCIGYVNTPKPLVSRSVVIKEARDPREMTQIVKLYVDTYGEVDFLEKDTWYDVRKMKNLIAVDGSKFLGCATWEKQKDKLFLLAVLTVPKYFRQGIATKLLNKIKNTAKELKLPKIFVPISNDDLVSYVFYHKNGFNLAGVDIGLPNKRHGKEELGFWNLPCRDEFYFEYKMTKFFKSSKTPLALGS